jgi:hypothetical protein
MNQMILVIGNVFWHGLTSIFIETNRAQVWGDFEITFGALGVLLRSDDWDFDVFKLGEITSGHPLRCLMVYLFNLLRFDSLGISSETFHKFVNAVENGYNDVPYHNKYHAADVVQAVWYFHARSSFKDLVTKPQLLAALIASCVHDLGHRGRSNAFEIDAESGLAIRYNDQSVLENHHVSLAFRLLQVPELNIFSKNTKAFKKEMRELIVRMVLGTDMKGHFQQVANLKAAIEGHLSSRTWFKPSVPKDRDLILTNVVHLADISSPCKPARISVKWTRRLEQEWFEEGDEQKQFGLQIGPMMDRNNACTEESQVGFFKLIVKPLLMTWTEVVGPEAVAPLVQNLELNISYWQAQVEKKKSKEQDIEYDDAEDLVEQKM